MARVLVCGLKATAGLYYIRRDEQSKPMHMEQVQTHRELLR